MIVIVDRIEGQYAVMEFPDRTTTDVPLSTLPDGTKPGDCFNFEEGTFTLDPDLTLERNARLHELNESMWND